MYFVLLDVSDDEDGIVYLSEAPDIDDSYELKKGLSVAARWPSDVTFAFPPDRPEALELTDFVGNSKSWLIINAKIRRVFDDLKIPDLEYLPIQIKNHKGRLASTDHVIANITKLTPAVDHARSDFTGKPHDIFAIDRLAINPELEKSGPFLLRVAERTILILARQELVDAMRAAGVTGVKYIPSAEYID